jgi:hypothetical protein
MRWLDGALVECLNSDAKLPQAIGDRSSLLAEVTSVEVV